jgi:probable phosphoglycerate mutase
MKKRVDFYLFRHGRTDANIENRIQGRGFDISLNEDGIAEAEKLSANISDISLEVIYSSPLKRALETGGVLAKAKSIPLMTVDQLGECDYGYASGKLQSEIPPEQLALYKGVNRDFCFEGGESQYRAAARVIDALRHIAETTDKTRIGISTHGGIIRYLMSHIFDTPQGFGIPYATPFHIVYEEGEFTLDKDCEGYMKLLKAKS